MTFGMYAPLPPARSGVADYAATLLDALRQHGEIAANPAQCDIALYHAGNNQLHREIYERALAQPGAVVLHDAVLQHFFLGSLSESAYIAEFVYNYGEWSSGLAQQLWNERARSAADPRYFAYPMLRRLAESARVVIVHNPAAAQAVTRAAPQARVVEIPHFFAAPANLAIPEPRDAAPLVVGVFGHLRETKRLPVILRAAERAGHKVRLIIAGAFASTDLERSLTPWRDSPLITFTGALDEPSWWQQAAAVDVCVNLRDPSAHETSGIGVRLMGLGKTVIFTAGPELAHIPESACLRIPADEHEVETLESYLHWLAHNRQAAREIGRRAAQHIAREHSLDAAAQKYWEVLRTL
jgi:glycosyltransferase involved in cell wall biosynthesis